MFTSRVWRQILDRRVRPEDFKRRGTYFITAAQYAAIAALDDSARRRELQTTFVMLDLRGTPASLAQRHLAAGLPLSSCGADGLFGQLAQSLKTRGNDDVDEDVVIAEAAIRNGFYVVAALNRVVQSIGALGGRALTVEEMSGLAALGPGSLS
jgi:hypothetical protein